MSLSEFRKGCDALLVTVNDAETDALRAALSRVSRPCLSPKPVRGAFRTYDDYGLIYGAHVVHVRSEMGSDTPGGATLTVSRGIDEVAPRYIVMVGIAFGVDPKSQPIGTILVSKQIQGYDLQRIGTTKVTETPLIVLRGDLVTASVRLLDLVEYARRSWTGNKICIGKLLSGQKLIDNYDYRKNLEDLTHEALGGEMEGQGLYAAAKDRAEWILIKAVCDWADGNKAKNKLSRQRKAADAAASFLIHILRDGGLGISSGKDVAADSSLRICIRHPLQRAKYFFGRDEDLEELTEWWANKKPTIQCQTLLGFGGTGKTALVEKFINVISHPDRNAYIFVWSFYVNENVIEMLNDFNQWCHAVGLHYDKLLILDGLELVQMSGLENTLRGSIFDKSLRLLLGKIIGGTDAACRALVTSRYSLVDFNDWEGTSYREKYLSHLSDEGAKELLKALGVKADDHVLGQIVQQCGGHALTLTVWGSYIAFYHDGIPQESTTLDLDEAKSTIREARVLNRCLTEHAVKLSDEERLIMSRLAEDLQARRGKYQLGVLKKLQRLGLISLFDENDHVVVHPALRDFFYLIKDVAAKDIRFIANRQVLELEEQPGFVRGECLRCGATALIESIHCDECDVPIDEEPDYIDSESGHVVGYVSDHRGETSALECPDCGNTELSYEFSSFCSYCDHKNSKDE